MQTSVLGTRILIIFSWVTRAGLLDCLNPCGQDSGREVGLLAKAAFLWEGWGGRWKSSTC